MRFEIFMKAPESCESIELPSLAAEIGSKRIEEAEKILGKENLDRAIKRVGAYLLEEELTDKLRMKGLQISADGEWRVMSANRWKRNVRAKEVSGEVIGVLLSEKERKTFQSVTRSFGGFKSPTEALEFCRHLFFEQNLKVIVQYTAPRFHQG